MSVELIKKPINVYQTIDEQQKEELIETGMIVPDSKPDVMNVLLVDADAIVKTREKTGKVMEVGGEICYQLIYRADNQDQSLEAIQVRSPWSISCNYPAKEEEVYTLVKCSVEHTNVDIINGRKLSAKSVVKLNIKFLLAKTFDAGEALAGENIYQKADMLEIAMLEDIGDKTVTVAENVELASGKPAMEEIIYSHGSLRDIKVNDNMTLEAVLDVDFLYRADNDDRDVENIHLEIPVNKNLDIENYSYTNVSANAEVKSLVLKPDEDLDGLLTRVKIDAELGVEYTLYANENIRLVKDAYALEYDFELEKKPVTVGVEERDMKDHLQVNGVLSLDCDNEAIEEIVNLTVKPRVLSVEKDNEGIMVNGCLDICVLYGTGLQMRVIRGSNQEMTFAHKIVLPEGAQPYEYHIVLALDTTAYEIISDTELNIKAQVDVQVHLSKKKQVNIVMGVKGVKPVERKENPPLLIYYTQQGDTLWDIARKYRVPIQKILTDNEMTEEKEPVAGQKILFVS